MAFSSHLSTYKANIKIITIYSHSYKTIGQVYGLENLNFLYFCKNLKLLENWYIRSIHPLYNMCKFH